MDILKDGVSLTYVIKMYPYLHKTDKGVSLTYTLAN